MCILPFVPSTCIKWTKVKKSKLYETGLMVHFLLLCFPFSSFRPPIKKTSIRWEVRQMENFFSEEWLKRLGQSGFPAILTIYLLTRFERKFDELSKLIQRLVAVQKNDESD